MKTSVSSIGNLIKGNVSDRLKTLGTNVGTLANLAFTAIQDGKISTDELKDITYTSLDMIESEITNVTQDFNEILGSVTGNNSGVAMNVLEYVEGTLLDVGKNVTENVLDGVFTTLDMTENERASMKENIKGILKVAGENALDTAKQVHSEVKETLKTTKESVKENIKQGKASGESSSNIAKQVNSEVKTALKTIGKSVAEGVKEGVSTTLDMTENERASAKEDIKGILKVAGENALSTTKNILSYFAGSIKPVSQNLLSRLSKA